ncbi:MAG: GxxExxY protein [Gloeobacteraceae cyanobacterium ES-bin-316]|nr:GxxExxY protein [Ferruginibacter sp.]
MHNLTVVEEFLSKQIVDCAYKVHSTLGPGLLEKIYEVCFCHELSKRDIPFKRQVQLPIVYDSIVFDEGLKLDVLVDEKIICEFKAVDIVNPLWQAQVLSHLKLTGLHVGFVINFNVPIIKNGLRRYCVE